MARARAGGCDANAACACGSSLPLRLLRSANIRYQRFNTSDAPAMRDDGLSAGFLPAVARRCGARPDPAVGRVDKPLGQQETCQSVDWRRCLFAAFTRDGVKMSSQPKERSNS